MAPSTEDSSQINSDPGRRSSASSPFRNLNQAHVTDDGPVDSDGDKSMPSPDSSQDNSSTRGVHGSSDDEDIELPRRSPAEMGISQPGNNGQNTAGDMIQTGEDLPHEPQWATPTVEDMVCLGEGCSWGLADHVAHMLENAHLNGDQDGRGEET